MLWIPGVWNNHAHQTGKCEMKHTVHQQNTLTVCEFYRSAAGTMKNKSTEIKALQRFDGGSFFFTFWVMIKTGMFSEDSSVIGFSIPANFTDLLIHWFSAVPTWGRGKNTPSNPENIVPQMFARHRSNPRCFLFKNLHINLLLLLHGTNNGNNTSFFLIIWLCSHLPCKLTTVQLLY